MRWPLGRELLPLVALVLWAGAPLALLLVHYLRHGGTFTGAVGKFPPDQFQYLAWIREAGDHVLVANPFRLGSSAHVFLHPMFLPSGLAWRAGVSQQLAFLLWQPVALAVLFAGVRAYAHRMLPAGGWLRPAAIALALLFATPTMAFVVWTGLGPKDSLQLIGHVLSPSQQLWGYFHAALAVGLTPAFFLGVERLAAGESRGGRGTLLWTTGAGVALSWLHPWQGETAVLVTVLALLWGGQWRGRPGLALPVAAALAPLGYYYLLSRTDPDWELARTATSVGRPVWWALAALAPLALVGAAGVRRPAGDLGERILLLWPLVGVALYLKLSPSYPYNALEGIVIPLGILAVRGWRRLRLPALAGALALALATLPGMAVFIDQFRDQLEARSFPVFLTSAETRAIAYLSRAPGDGGVLSDLYLGAALPSLTGRSVFAGHPTWTPDAGRRALLERDLFDGRLRGPGASRALTRTGARFVFTDCHDRLERSAVRPAARAVRRFGCGAVYELR